MDWRYDPIILDDRYTLEFHKERFEMLCGWLSGHTTRCIISFVDDYKNSPFQELSQEEMEEAAAALSAIAAKYKLPLYSCAEKVNLESFGIRHGACIDREKIQRITGYNLDVKKDRGQRRECGCCESIDIGIYNTCIHGCKYCYATASVESARSKHSTHNPRSPILIGDLQGDEIITSREMWSLKDNQISLFDF